MQGTTQNYTLDMADGTAPKPLIVKQGDTNSREARISLTAFKEPWTIPFGCQIHINVRKNDMTYANATCTQENEHTVLAPITEQMTAVPGTQLGELFFLGSDGDIRSQTFPLVVWDAVSDLDLEASSNDFQALKAALRDVKISTDAAGIATQYATEQGNAAGMAAQRAEDAADSIQEAVDAAANAKVCESNARGSELAAAQTQQEVTDYVEAQKAAFMGYSKRESDSRYANALTNSVTGEGGVTVDDAWTAPVLGLDVVGKSEQATTTGAQLLPQPQFNDTKNGITVKTQMDGGISITGTATSAIAFTVAEILLPAGTYILSGLSGLVVGRMYFQLVEISAQGGQFVGELAKVGPVASATVTIDRDVWARAEIKVLSGVTADSICYPMLNAGDTALPWEPYTGGAPSPSPDYPQDIISVGTVSTGKQIFFKALVTLQGTGAEADITDKRAIKITYTRANGGKYAGFIVDDKSNIVGKTLTISYGSIIPSKSGLTPGIRLYWIDINGSVLSYVVYVNKSPTTITIEDPQNDMATKLALLLYADVGDAAVVNDYVIYKDIMINAGDTALPWEPYTGGKPSPSVEYPAELELVLTNKNLLPLKNIDTVRYGVTFKLQNDGSIKANGTVTGTGTCTLAELRLMPGKYTYSGLSGQPDNSIVMQLFEIDAPGGTVVGTSLAIIGTTTGSKVITIERPMWVRARTAIFDGAIINVVFYPMLNAGDTPLPWEPYQSTSATITLTEPLRGIGDYRDRVMCRDWEWGIERWITKLTLAGNEDWVIYDNSSYISFYTRNPCLPVSMNKREGLCEQLRVMTIGGKNLNTIWLGANNKVVYAIDNQFYDDTLEDKGLANWKAHLAEFPLEIITYLDAPTWEPLPAATQQALNELTTYAGTTHLTITAGGPAPDITLEYVQDTQKAIEQHDTANRQYTDNQIAAIVAALPTAMQAAIVDNQTTKLLQEV